MSRYRLKICLVISSIAIALAGTCALSCDDDYRPKPKCEMSQILFSDAGLAEGADVWTWSGSDWGGPPGTFDGENDEENPPEGSECFKTCSGADWDGHRNYAGWGVVLIEPSDHTIDLSQCPYLSFWVKTPYDLKVEIQEGGRDGRKFSVQISDHGWDGNDSWQMITVPAGAFEGADLANIFGPFLVTVERGDACFFVDDVRWGSDKREVRVLGRQILLDEQPFTMRGMGYSPTPIGEDPNVPPHPPLTYDIFSDASIRERDFPLLRDMGCNAIRTWGKVTSDDFLREAESYGIYVVMGFWVNPADYGDENTRDTLLEEFKTYVREFKDHSAVLMWSIGNEQNYDWMHQGDIKDWYSLVNEMAKAAHEIEGPQFHPVTTPNGEVLNIGDPDSGTDDASLPYLDVWGANIYRGCSFHGLFSDYGARSAKPFWVSEYGTPALNESSGEVDEVGQAQCLETLWTEIVANSALCSGGAVMEYCDEWWKAGDPDVQDLHREEWWGVLSIALDPGGGADRLTRRQAYFKLLDLWKP